MNYIISKHTSKVYNYHPKTWNELKELINKLIKERGLEADLNDIDTSYITDMSSLFTFSDFNGDISEWDVSNVIDMSDMFDGSSFNGDISNWYLSKIKNIKNVFNCSPLQNNTSKWYKQ